MDLQIRRGILITIKTQFFLASVTKTLTAAAIFKLHEEHKLSVYDRVDKYIPGVIKDKTDSLTILNLLNHTSGMAANLAHSDDFSKAGPAKSFHDITTLEQLIDNYYGTKLKSKPGEKFEYNNYGYILFAYIIEKASGMDYLDYMDKAIFSEAGMTETTDQKYLSGKPAVGYLGIGTDNISPVQDETYPAWFKGSAGLYSSTDDLYKFMKSVFTCRFSSGQTLDLMLDTCIDIHRKNILWTAGWQRAEVDGHDFYSHSGSKEGFSTIAGYLPDNDISVIILSNLVRDCSNGQTSVNFSFVDNIAPKIISIMDGKSVASLPLPKNKVSGDPSGSYRLDEDHYLNISFQQDVGNIS
jgi:CubicO group peptidase (beta-lactamase class C family)